MFQYCYIFNFRDENEANESDENSAKGQGPCSGNHREAEQGQGVPEEAYGQVAEVRRVHPRPRARSLRGVLRRGRGPQEIEENVEGLKVCVFISLSLNNYLCYSILSKLRQAVSLTNFEFPGMAQILLTTSFSAPGAGSSFHPSYRT